MPIEQQPRTVREAVGVFDRPEDLQHAIDELLSSGFHRAELSLLAGEHAVEEKLGHRYMKVSALADHPTVPRAAYVSNEAIGTKATFTHCRRRRKGVSLARETAENRHHRCGSESGAMRG